MKQAPEALEQKLVEAFRQHHAARSALGQRIWLGLAAAIAIAGIVGVMSFLGTHPQNVRRTVAMEVARPAKVVPAAAPSPMAPVATIRGVHRPRHAVPKQPPQQEVTTGFLPLDASSAPPTSGEVIRMDMPRSTLALFGLPVDEQRLSVPVRADVLYGEDGMAHAVRFVTTTSYETQRGR